MTGFSEQAFTVERDGSTIPGVAWFPDGAAGPVPLVLLGHGGNGHKRQDYIAAAGRALAKRFGTAAAAIDGPVHGERRLDGGADTEAVFTDFRATWKDPAVTDRMVADWKATLDWLLASFDRLDASRVGYWGLSMGTMFGLPFVAAEPRVRAAVLGLMGTIDGHYGQRLAADAPKIASIPVRFMVQWDDELVPRDDALNLFGAIATKEKCLHASPGRHAMIPPDEMRDSWGYIAGKLADLAV